MHFNIILARAPKFYTIGLSFTCSDQNLAYIFRLSVPTDCESPYFVIFSCVFVCFLLPDIPHNTFLSNNFFACSTRHISHTCKAAAKFLVLYILTLRRLMSYIYMEHPFLMFLDHTQRRSTVGRTPLDE